MSARDEGTLFVGNFLSASGANISYAEELTGQLERRGWRILRTSTWRSKPRRLVDMVYTTLRRRRDYARAHVDVFSGPAFTWAEAVAFALRRLGKPFAMTLHGGNLPAFSQQWPRRVGRVLRSADVVTAPSRYLATALAPLRSDIEVIPNAIDAAAFGGRARTTPRARLIWLRAFQALYNPVLAIDVVARVRASHPDVHLDMLGPDLGDGTLEATRARIAELGLDAAVTIHGRVPKHEIPGFVDRADILLNTTDVDNTPVSVREAMAGGLCVASTSVGGLPYLIDDGRDGLLVPPRDPEAMASAVLRLLDDPALFAQISRAARASAGRCDWAPVLDRWDHALEQLGHG